MARPPPACGQPLVDAPPSCIRACTYWLVSQSELRQGADPPARQLAWRVWLREVLPQGRRLPEAAWEARHRGILVVAFAHAVGLALFGLARGWGPVYSFGEGALIGGIALLGVPARFGRRWRSAMTVLALVTSSAVLTQFWGGYVEAHFHYFIVVAIAALYQDWAAFTLSIAFVAISHGVVGTTYPQWIYNHPAAIAHPWLWGGIHAGLIAGECAALTVVWKQSERERASAEGAAETLRVEQRRLAEAHRIARIGTFEWNARTGAFTVTSDAKQIHGIDPEGPMTLADLLARVIPEDRPLVQAAFLTAAQQRSRVSLEYRLALGDGRDRVIHAEADADCETEGPEGCLVGTFQDVSERRAAERASARLAAIVESSQDVIVSKGLDGTIQSWNAAAERLYGYTADEAIGRNIRIIIPEERRAEYETKIAAIRLGERVAPFETERVAKDGTRVHAYIVLSPIRVGGVVRSAAAIHRDIGELKRAEEQLRASEARLREIVEYSTNLFYTHTPDRVLTYVSPQARAFFQCEPEEALVDTASFFTDNPLNAKGLEAAEHAIRTGEPQPPYEMELVGRKGRRLWVEVNEAPVVRDGRTIRIVGALTDITHRKRAEEKFRGLLEAAPDGMVIVDADGRIVLANRQTERLFGYPREEILGAPVEILIPERFRAGHAGHRDSYVHAPRVRPMGAGLELFGRRKDGTDFPVEISLSPLETEEGMLVSSSSGIG